MPSGPVRGETVLKIEFFQADTSRLTIDRNQVVSRRLLNSSSIPNALMESPDELRNLLTHILLTHILTERSQ